MFTPCFLNDAKSTIFASWKVSRASLIQERFLVYSFRPWCVTSIAYSTSFFSSQSAKMMGFQYVWKTVVLFQSIQCAHTFSQSDSYLALRQQKRNNKWHKSASPCNSYQNLQLEIPSLQSLYLQNHFENLQNSFDLFISMIWDRPLWHCIIRRSIEPNMIFNLAIGRYLSNISVHQLRVPAYRSNEHQLRYLKFLLN